MACCAVRGMLLPSLPLLLLLLCPSADAYAHMSEMHGSGSARDRRYAWSLPAPGASFCNGAEVNGDVAPDSICDASNTYAGLGGGITYAIDSSVCDSMLEQFREQSVTTFSQVMNLGVTFVDCGEIHDAIGRAFGTWASNHKLIEFKDVSRLCKAGSAEAGSAETAHDCPIAEVSIDAHAPETDTDRGRAAYVNIYGRAIDRENDDWQNYPNGRRTTGNVTDDDANTYAIAWARMRYLTHNCWYLDNTFCAPLHAMSELADLLMKVGLLVAWALGFLMALAWLADAGDRMRAEMKASGEDPAAGEEDEVAAAFGATRRRRGWLCCCSSLYRSCCRKVSAAATGLLDAVERLSGLSVTVSLLLIVAPPLAYIRVYLPCIECFDFEATTAHEIGHVLGFHHPNEEGNLNYYAAAGQMNESLCKQPLNTLEQLTTTSEDASIMYATTTHNSRACLAADDLDGLNYLYPSCDLVRARGEPLCVKSKRRSGFLRLLLAISVPVLVGTLITLVLQSYAARRERKRFTRLAKNLHALKRRGSLGALRDFDLSLLEGPQSKRQSYFTRMICCLVRPLCRCFARAVCAVAALACRACCRRCRQQKPEDEGEDDALLAKKEDEKARKEAEAEAEGEGGRRLTEAQRRDAMRDFQRKARAAGERAEELERRDAARNKWLIGGARAIACAHSGEAARASKADKANGKAPELKELFHLFEPAPVLAFVRTGELGALRAPLGRLSRCLREMHGELTSAASHRPASKEGGGWFARRERAVGGERGPLPGGKVGTKHDLYRRLSNQVPLLCDSFVEGDERETRELAAMLRGVECLEDDAVRAAWEARHPPPKPVVRRIRKAQQRPRSDADPPAAVEAAGEGGEAAAGVPAAEAAVASSPAADDAEAEAAPAADAPADAPAGDASSAMPAPPAVLKERDSYKQWKAWNEGKFFQPAAVEQKARPVMPWDSPKPQTTEEMARQEEEALAKRNEAAGPRWGDNDEGAAWQAWQREANASGGGLLSSLGIGGSRGRRRRRQAMAHDAGGTRGLRFAPLLKHDERANFLRWFADVSSAVPAPKPGDEDGGGLPSAAEVGEEAAEAAAEAMAAVRAVTDVFEGVEGAVRRQKERLAAPKRAKVKPKAAAQPALAADEAAPDAAPAPESGRAAAPPPLALPGCVTPSSAAKAADVAEADGALTDRRSAIPRAEATKSKPERRQRRLLGRSRSPPKGTAKAEQAAEGGSEAALEEAGAPGETVDEIV